MFIILGLLFSASAIAQGRSDFRIERKGGPDLVSESAKLQLIKEPKMQTEGAIKDRSYAIGLGRYDSGFVNVKSDGTETGYDLSEATPMFRLSYAQLPWLFEGQLGWQVNMAYGFQELKAGIEKVALHMLPLSAEIIYRARLKDKQLWAPQIGAGVGLMSYFQRGGQGLNTSGSEWFTTLSGSIWFGIGEWLDPGSMAPVDMTLSYSQIYAQENENADWDGQTWFLSMGVSL